MEDARDSGSHAGFLPPQPLGPEPDLGARPADRSRAPAAPLPGGFAPPAEHEAHAPQSQPPPSPPDPRSGRGGPQPVPWAQQGGPANGAAVAGLTLSVTAGGLLLLSAGLSSIISVACAVLGIVYSHKGRARVDRGETLKHRGMAQAGFVTGIVTLVMSILATLAWAAFAVLYTTDPEFRQGLEDQLDDGDDDAPGGFETSLRLGCVAIRLLAVLAG